MPRPMSILLLVTLAGSCAAALEADVIVEGQRAVRYEPVLRFGPIRDRLETSYVVRKGDTLAAIAKRELGAETRFPEILARNPGVDPKRLAVSARLILPPRETDPEKHYPHVFLVWSGRTPGVEPRILRPGDEMPYGRYGLEVLAVPVEKLAQLRREDQTERFDREKIEALAGKHVSGRFYPVRTVATTDPTARVEGLFTVHGVKGGKVLLVQKNTYRNSRGKVVRVEVHVSDPSLDEEKKDEVDDSWLPLVPIVFTGGLGLVWLMVRKRRVPVNAPAPSLA